MKKTDNQKVNDQEKQVVEEVNVDQSSQTQEAKEDTTDKMSENQVDEALVWQDKYARLSAEFDNFRKRTVKEKMDLIANGGEKVLKAIIEIVDDFERALKSMNSESTEYMGVELIYKKFNETLKSNGVTKIEALNEPLNVDFHEAVAKFPTEDKDKVGYVIDVVQNGYMLHDKVLRFAKVVVGE